MPNRSCSFDLTGRVAIVTGASQGIGASIAQQFAESGALTIVHYNSNRRGAEAVVDAVVQSGGTAQVVQADLKEEGQVRSVIERARECFGGLDVLVNNAGIYPNQTIETLSIDEWRRMYETNVESAFLCLKYAVPLLENSSAASVINIASISATSPGYQHSHYNSSKAALVSFTKSAAQELGAKAIRVNSISPGLVWREGLEEAWPDGVERWLSKVPLGRLGMPDEIASACLFLASSASSWITGHDLVVDGGILSTSAY